MGKGVKRGKNDKTVKGLQPGPSNEGTLGKKKQKLVKTRTSPRKLRKGKGGKQTKQDCGAAKAVFMDDSTEMVFEVTNQEDGQFPSDSKVEIRFKSRSKECESSAGRQECSDNNNATVSRADKFRRMVAEESQRNSMERGMDNEELATMALVNSKHGGRGSE